MGYSVIHVDEIEPSGPGGAVRFVRRELGVEAFGINWFELPPNVEGREHDESETGPGGIASKASSCPFASGRSCVSIRARRASRWPDPTA